MHRKSLEAAETLKNSDEGSDKEDSKTEESDGSVISSISKAPSASPKGNSGNGPLNNNTSNSTNNNNTSGSNVTPNPVGSPVPLQAHHHQHQSPPGAHHSPPLPHHLAHHPPPGGASPMDTNRQDYNSSTSPSNSNRSYASSHHETDSEVFRWVNYNQHSIR